MLLNPVHEVGMHHRMNNCIQFCQEFRFTKNQLCQYRTVQTLIVINILPK